MKYKLGDTVFWVESSTWKSKTIPCQVCFGKRSVTIILGNGESVCCPCGACDHGLEYATGTQEVREPGASVESGAIEGISTRDGLVYQIGYHTKREGELFDSFEDAKPELKRQLEEVKEAAKRWFLESFRTATKKQLWSFRYHQGCIADAERNISWHKARIGMIQERKK